MRFTTKLIPSSSGNVGILELNNPKAFHALTIDMIHSMEDVLTQWYAPTSNIRAIIMKSNLSETKRPAFCSGGDVKTIYHAGITADKANNKHGTGFPGLPTSEFFRHEYKVDHLLATSVKPQVSLWDGIVMGGGAGISMHGKYRIATENTVFAMPETAIGLFPDVGSTWWMPRLLSPGVATYLSLTGARLQPEDLLYTGVATHYVPSHQLDALQEAIVTALLSSTSSSSSFDNNNDNNNFLAPVLMSFHENPAVDPLQSKLAKNKETIEHIFGPALRSKDNNNNLQTGTAQDGAACLEIIQGIVSNLQEKTKTNDDDAFAKETLDTLLKMSPTSLAVTMMGLRMGQRADTIETVFRNEYRMSQGCMRPGSDFYEGIRAVLVDKDNQPKWNPATLDDVKPETLASYFQPLSYEWEPLPAAAKTKTTSLL